MTGGLTSSFMTSLLFLVFPVGSAMTGSIGVGSRTYMVRERIREFTESIHAAPAKYLYGKASSMIVYSRIIL